MHCQETSTTYVVIDSQVYHRWLFANPVKLHGASQVLWGHWDTNQNW